MLLSRAIVVTPLDGGFDRASESMAAASEGGDSIRAARDKRRSMCRSSSMRGSDPPFIGER